MSTNTQPLLQRFSASEILTAANHAVVDYACHKYASYDREVITSSPEVSAARFLAGHAALFEVIEAGQELPKMLMPDDSSTRQFATAILALPNHETSFMDAVYYIHQPEFIAALPAIRKALSPDDTKTAEILADPKAFQDAITGLRRIEAFAKETVTHYADIKKLAKPGTIDRPADIDRFDVEQIERWFNRYAEANMTAVFMPRIGSVMANELAKAKADPSHAIPGGRALG